MHDLALERVELALPLHHVRHENAREYLLVRELDLAPPVAPVCI